MAPSNAQDSVTVGKSKADVPAVDRGNHDREAVSIILPGQTPAGGPILSVLVKRTYTLIDGGKSIRSPQDRQLSAADVYYEKKMTSSVQFESDFVPFKLKTDIVVNGTAYAPNRKAVEALKASVSVGTIRKEILVIGDRTCHYGSFTGATFSQPKPFTEMPIRYERAYGGVDTVSNPGLPLHYPRNPAGKGFLIKDSRQTLEGLQLPNIEDPLQPLRPDRLCADRYESWPNMPKPQGFGWTAKSWQPRCAAAGTMPGDIKHEEAIRHSYAAGMNKNESAVFEKTRLPVMDFSFFNGASTGLSVPYLKGDEEISLVNLTPSSTFTTGLPGQAPAIRIDIGDGPVEVTAVLQTLLIRMDEHEFDLVWRGAVEYPGMDWLPQMKRMSVFVEP
ncbi:MAG: DUF2169 domain-containing protein [Chitinivibrionales bacterium]|nr:DUF2169 domain-containing protein [Chitinivibrionales bacterium]